MSETERREQILQAALQVFSKHGYHQASIKTIARAADIKSAALIYHYFHDKKALLKAVIEELSPARDLPMLRPETAQQLMSVDPEILLEQVAKSMLSLLDDTDMQNFMRLFLSDAARMPDVAELFVDTQQQMLHFLASYFQYHMEQGRLREHDPQVAARAFIGMLLVYLMAHLVFTPLAETFPVRDAYVKEIIRIYLEGLRSKL